MASKLSVGTARVVTGRPAEYDGAPDEARSALCKPRGNVLWIIDVVN